MFNDGIKATGTLIITVKDQTGKVKNETHVKNLVVTLGKNFIASRMKETGRPNEITHMAIGTGSTPAAASNTALEAEVARVALTVTGGTVLNNTISYSATFPENVPVSTTALREAALLNAATDGILLARTVYPVVTKEPTDLISITWVITIN